MNVNIRLSVNQIYLMARKRNGMDLTEAEDIKKRCKNTQENYTKKIFVTQITTMV